MNSPLPTPPTDNLYKFMAIAGLVLLAASVYFPLVLKNKLEDQLSQTEESISVLNADLDYALLKQGQVLRILTNSILLQNGQYTNSPNVLELKYSEDELKKKVDETFDLVRQAKVGRARLETSHQRVITLFRQVGLVVLWQRLFVSMSLLLIILGFRFWYSRIQVHLERELKALPKEPPASDHKPVHQSKHLE